MHRIAILLAALVFVLVGTGSFLTSPLPGAASGVVTNVPLMQTHEVLAVAALILALALSPLAFGKRPRKGVAAIARVSGVLIGVEIVLGFQPSSAASFHHAALAAALFSLVVALAVFTSPKQDAPLITIENPWPPLQRLAIWTPVLVLVQTMLGAAFRHNSIGVVWHILNSMVVLMAILVLGIGVLRQYPTHPTLRPAALALLVITGLQVLLGFGVYLTLLMVSENNAALTIASAVHVMTGSLTLAASVVLTIQLRASRSAAPRRGTA